MRKDIKQAGEFVWDVEKTDNMNVPGRIYSSVELIGDVVKDNGIDQVKNVARLPGIVKASLAMPDIHWGYGFPIGGMAAFDWDKGVISPGGVGYDINCGVRLAVTSLTESDVQPKISKLATALHQGIPSGVGSTGSVKLDKKEVLNVLKNGSKWAVENGFGVPSDVDRTEEQGCLAGADPEAVSDRAITRGLKQLGTLGSGNHFLEIQVVDKIFDQDAARAFGISLGQVVVMLHSGSRGLGHQVCDDYLSLMTKQAAKLDIELPDKQLSCAYINSERGMRYFQAMCAAANYAWANRQILLHQTRKIFQQVFTTSATSLAMNLVYDVCHNIAKKENHIVDGKEQTLCVHRKGATRAFPPGHSALCDAYKEIGQPTLIPGDMGSNSFILKGTQKAMDETFGSTCHGAGRRLSRTAAKKLCKGRAIHRELLDKGVHVKWTGRSTLPEEMPEAYKDIEAVVEVVHGAGLSLKVAKMRPIGVVKG